MTIETIIAAAAITVALGQPVWGEENNFSQPSSNGISFIENSRCGGFGFENLRSTATPTALGNCSRARRAEPSSFENVKSIAPLPANPECLEVHAFPHR